MTRIKLFLKTITYSFKIAFASSKLIVFISFVLRTLEITFPFVYLYLIKNIFDELTKVNVNMSVIIIYILLFVTLIIIRNVVSTAANIIEELVSKKISFKYNSDMLEKICKLPMEIIDSSDGRNMFDELRQAGFSVNSLPRTIITLVSVIYSLCIALFILVKLNVWFVLLYLVLSIPGVIFDVFFKGKIEDLRRKMAPDVRKFSYYRWMLTDKWPAKDVRMYGLTDPIRERYKHERDKYIKENKKLDLKQLWISLPIEIISRSGIIMISLFVINQAINGKITLGDITLYIGSAETVCGSIRTLLSTFSLWYITIVDRMKYVFDFFDLYCPDEHKGIRPLEKFKSLEFVNVYFKYPSSEQYVLNGVSFKLNKGDKLSILGINGAGKTTIIKLMLGFYKINSGEILINGYPMTDYSMKDIRKMFTVLFQNFVQFPLTLRENIALSCLEQKDNDEKIIIALKQSRIYKECENFKNGLDTYMTREFDDEGVEMSKGQWQKIALSRAYFKNADIVIFDEPSSALDAGAEDKIFQNFASLSDNKTGIMISHRISSARLSNKVIVLDDGKIVESGTHNELIALDGLYAKLYNLQREKYVMKEEDCNKKIKKSF